jgi:hypothetical protein
VPSHMLFGSACMVGCRSESSRLRSACLAPAVAGGMLLRAGVSLRLCHSPPPRWTQSVLLRLGVGLGGASRRAVNLMWFSLSSSGLLRCASAGVSGGAVAGRREGVGPSISGLSLSWLVPAEGWPPDGGPFRLVGGGLCPP